MGGIVQAQGCAAAGTQCCETGAHEAHGEHKVQGARRVAFVMGAGKGSGLGLHICKVLINLSGGQIQRVEIARALLSGRPILLADEATSALDPRLSLEIHETLLGNPKIAVVEVAHKITDIEKAMFDQIIVLDKVKDKNAAEREILQATK